MDSNRTSEADRAGEAARAKQDAELAEGRERLSATGYFDSMDESLPPSGQIIEQAVKRQRMRKRRFASVLSLAACFLLVLVVAISQGTGPLAGVGQGGGEGGQSSLTEEAGASTKVSEEAKNSVVPEQNATADDDYENVYQVFQKLGLTAYYGTDSGSGGRDVEIAGTPGGALRDPAAPATGEGANGSASAANGGNAAAMDGGTGLTSPPEAHAAEQEAPSVDEAPPTAPPTEATAEPPAAPPTAPPAGSEPDSAYDMDAAAPPDGDVAATPPPADAQDSESAAGAAEDLESSAAVTVEDSADATSGKQEHSDTNNQVVGVQEADIVKTDGTYIYTANSEAVNILLAGDGHPEVLATIPQRKGGMQSGQGWFDMFAAGDRLVLIRSSYGNADEDGSDDGDARADGAIRYPGGNGFVDTCVDIYDISDRKKPKNLQSLGQSGNYSNSRMVGDVLYLISTYDSFDLSALDKDEPKSYVPLYAEGKKQSVTAPSDIMMLPDAQSASYTVVSGIDTKKGKFVGHESVFGGYPTVYSTAKNLYLAAAGSREEVTENKKHGLAYHTYIQTTQITRIALDGGDVTAKASASVDGTVNNQFSFDEYKDVLRVVTTEYRWTETVRTQAEYYYEDADGTGEDGEQERYYEDGESDSAQDKPKEAAVIDSAQQPEDQQTSSLYTLDSKLRPMGKVSDLAPGEVVYSARFMGDIGYFVTFRQVDPLFSVDLKDPYAPKVIGELKIPGFSEYLQQYEPGLLLGFGKDADMYTGSVNSLKLTMFDNSDPSDVREKETLVLDDLLYSEASGNHKAILADARKGIIAFPAESQYVICSYDEKKGFARIVDIAYDAADTGWGTAGLRGLFIGDVFYVVSPKSVNTYDMADGFKKIARLVLSEDAGPAGQWYGWMDGGVIID
ncbi:MAG: beta-propeller domain-containing protein [Clostridiales Family XIII bacterium]|jgi:uncharacterized secreted protein with C-terminal beta-propeller domain|nr:beta-propeller domain-containing protein [Clostridiales Family XIII bacterium]